jgi:Putative auto-transporter adhesin, head GIN domain
MKRILFVLIAVGIASSIAAQKINDANAEVREAKNFHAIKLSSAFDVYITQSNEESVAVSASEEKYKNEIEVKVENGVLSIGLKKANWTKSWNTGKMKLRAYISFKNIDKLEVSGACDVNIQGTIKANDLSIVLSGASDIDGDFDVQKMKLDMSGASDMTVKGSASNLNIEASGASSFKGYDLKTDFCDVDVSGASSVRITVNKELSAKATGASDVKYQGDGLIRDIKTSGASSVSKNKS